MGHVPEQHAPLGTRGSGSSKGQAPGVCGQWHVSTEGSRLGAPLGFPCFTLNRRPFLVGGRL